MTPPQTARLVEEVRRLADEVSQAHTGRDLAFAAQRSAEQEVMLQLLDAMRPAFPWLADGQGRVAELPGANTREHWLVPLDTNGDGAWVACDHPELGLVIARRQVADAYRVWPGGDLPSGREGGPRLAKVLDGLVDRLLRQASGNSARRRREAEAMAERLRAVQTLLRAP